MKYNRKPKVKVRQILLANRDEFCRNTTLHGLKYIGDRDLTKFERTFFAISFIAVFFTSVYFIINVYDKWTRNPVIVGIGATPTYIHKIPFPATTICNMNQAMASVVKDIKNNTLQYSMLQILCNRGDDINMTMSDTSDWRIFEEFLITIAQPCSKMVLSCKFGANSYNCSHLFKPILTDEGLCCTFNLVHPSFMYQQRFHSAINYTDPEDVVPIDWSIEKGFPDKLPPKFYPMPVAGIGVSSGLSVILDADVDNYHCSSMNGAGFKILLHNPTELPNIKETGLVVEVGHETRFRIRTEKSSASNELRSIKKEARQCLFTDEKRLFFFRTYSRRNCEMECVADLYMRECNCVNYYMPRRWHNMTICGLKDTECVNRIRAQSSDFQHSDKDCTSICISNCFDLAFFPDSFSMPLSIGKFDIKDKLIQNMSDSYARKNIAVLHMYFKDNAFRHNTMTQFIGMTEFLSNTGGLMGLFLGFSFISLVELFFFIVIRPFYSTANNIVVPVSTTKRRDLQVLKLHSLKNFKNHRDIQNRIGNIGQIQDDLDKSITENPSTELPFYE